MSAKTLQEAVEIVMTTCPAHRFRETLMWELRAYVAHEAMRLQADMKRAGLARESVAQASVTMNDLIERIFKDIPPMPKAMRRQNGSQE